jgi:acetyltransferase
MWQHTLNLRLLFETPFPIQSDDIDREGAASLLRRVRETGRTLLTELESKALMACYGIPTVPTLRAESEEEAVEHADEIGYPVVLKLNSESITHKTDVGGVQLDLPDAEAVRAAYRAIRDAVAAKAKASDFNGVTVQPMIAGRDGYEVILGSSSDIQFGPVLLFGTGGQLVEVFQDRALALPPLTTTLARRFMERTKIFSAFRGIRGRRPIDVTRLEQLLVRFSWLVVENRIIKEIDINPLLVTPDNIVVLDARIVLHDPVIHETDLPVPAIRPYPSEYVRPWRLQDGTSVEIRPIRPEDEPDLIEFHKGLSDTSVRYRYFQLLKLSQRVAHERLARLCFIDYDREMALVVVNENRSTHSHSIIGIGRLIRMHGVPEAEFAVLVSDSFQRHGLGTEILRRLLEVGRNEGIKVIFAEILPENIGMQRVCTKLGFRLKTLPHEGIVRARIELD